MLRKQAGVTLGQIARQAGCSVTVVSKTLNGAKGNAGVGPEMQQTVLRIAKELGYTPNYHGRALQQGRARTLGLVCNFGAGSHPANAFWGQLVQGVERGTRNAHHDLLIIGPTGEMDELDHGIQCLRQRRIDALVVPAPLYTYKIQQMERIEEPVVFTATFVPNDYPCIGIDIGPGIAQAFAHLAGLGHRTVLWLPTTLKGEIIEPERDAIIRTMARQHGMQVETCFIQADAIQNSDTLEAIVDACQQQFAAYLVALNTKRPCTALIAYNEQVALGVYSALRDAGYQIPRDVSVIGFDDIFAHVAAPSMTVVSICLHAMGERAAELALEIVDGAKPAASYHGRYERLPTTLILRKSTAPPRSA